MSIVETLITMSTNTVRVGGETTDASGLAVVPKVDRSGRYTGRWAVTHQQSGLHVAISETTLAYARELATLLAPLADWTHPQEDMAVDGELRTHVVKLRRRHTLAVLDQEPLWWARWSWQQLAPHWVIQTDPPELLTWSRVVAYADAAELGWFAGEAPGFDPRSCWQLICAGPLCTPEVLRGGDWDMPLLSQQRAELRDEARAHGWTQHGARWLCPACVHEHSNPLTTV